MPRAAKLSATSAKRRRSATKKPSWPKRWRWSLRRVTGDFWFVGGVLLVAGVGLAIGIGRQELPTPGWGDQNVSLKADLSQNLNQLSAQIKTLEDAQAQAGVRVNQASAVQGDLTG